ncbi:unnamed protein product (macronuclear) [Paramecium tetraurelia]|uniref:Transmembrane protein n=1 Tax=Paramecium tetraurelia TaxID=5888 RepID=A0C382_PARTE|nr:uncharacterized protein GSPATT00034727001 [Paramecium tetraurelia]CAK65249.1 unnamed protein product [Paramecium tetraurelia]|eukprot:XP_001432646.1 hypothetical protein (macronuclear) [Paramecium tetraurelia strain d4-2]
MYVKFKKEQSDMKEQFGKGVALKRRYSIWNISSSKPLYFNVLNNSTPHNLSTKNKISNIIQSFPQFLQQIQINKYIRRRILPSILKQFTSRDIVHYIFYNLIYLVIKQSNCCEIYINQNLMSLIRIKKNQKTLLNQIAIELYENCQSQKQEDLKHMCFLSMTIKNIPINTIIMIYYIIVYLLGMVTKSCRNLNKLQKN